jgi:hypothetical protein
MDELMRDRFTEISDRLNDLFARVAKLEQENVEARQALVVALTKLKQMEARHRLRVLEKKKAKG